MKCSSRRNCDPAPIAVDNSDKSLNEVQFPKELRRHFWTTGNSPECLNEVQFPKELRLCRVFQQSGVSKPQ